MTNVAWTNVNLIVGICSRCSYKATFKVSSKSDQLQPRYCQHWVCGGWWCTVIFMSNPTFVLLGWVELWLSWGCDNIIKEGLCNKENISLAAPWALAHHLKRLEHSPSCLTKVKNGWSGVPSRLVGPSIYNLYTMIEIVANNVVACRILQQLQQWELCRCRWQIWEINNSTSRLCFHISLIGKTIFFGWDWKFRLIKTYYETETKK